MSIKKKLDSWLSRFEHSFATHNRIEISANAILHNFDLFSQLSSKQVVPVLKSNAYGHGLQLVATTLRQRTFPYIAVDGYFEALRIREVSQQPVLIMGAIKPENFSHMQFHDFAFVVQDEATIHALGHTKHKVNVHLECNTGMNRYGIDVADTTRFVKLILRYPNLHLEGAMSHLADSDGNDPATVATAAQKFDAFVETMRAAGAKPSIIHVAQTAGSLKAESRYATTIRLGIGLYGINPFSASHPLHDKLHDLQPALQLISTITRVIELQKGDQVSYNYTFTAPKAIKIGVLPLGYYEGVHRALSNKGFVKIGDNFAPIVGRVCMNHTMINLDGLSAKVGDEVIVYSNRPGDKNAIDAICAQESLFNYNLVTSLSSDVRRMLVT